MSKYTKEKLQAIVPQCKSMADVCRYFEVKPATGTQTHLSNKVKEWKIDISHFTGQAWNRGQSHPKKDALVYCFKGSTEGSHRLKTKLIRDGFNNELSNLQILCPNCHALQTRLRKQNGPVSQRKRK